MEKLRMKSLDASEDNVAKIAALFPQCVTERLNKDGKPELAIDFDKLRDELSKDLLDGAEERYQFTWPDKRAASRLANEATNKTLRPDVEASVDFWNTKNLYIEGDNLDVLKVLRENYLGAIKMIYIDPPYNTGNDFVYNDDFAQSREDFEATSGVFDEYGNRLIDPMQRNTESNGRFHTDWLNMIYPRLKVARDLLADDGVIFISMSDCEQKNLRNICDEIFGAPNFLAQLIWQQRKGGGNDSRFIATDHEYILIYTKNTSSQVSKWRVSQSEEYQKRYNLVESDGRRYYWDTLVRNGLQSPIILNLLTPTGEKITINSQWSMDRVQNGLLDGSVKFTETSKGWSLHHKVYMSGGQVLRTLLTEYGTNKTACDEQIALFEKIYFDYPKPSTLVKLLSELATDNNSIILDFFSGSATTAHAVMKLNAEDGGKRKFIMVQLPEITDEKSEARKAGYETICQIGEERIRRAGKQIRSEIDAKIASNEAAIKRFQSAIPSTSALLFLRDDQEEAAIEFYHKNIKPLEDDNERLLKLKKDLDIGFRVLKLDSSNMEDVFYTPEDFDAKNIFTTVDNVKPDRTPLDLLFQVLPELDIELSAKIEEKEVNGKKVFFVDGNYFIATFDTEVNESTVMEIAKMQPQYFVMRDASAANDNVLDNFEQIFRHYSPETIRKII